MPGSPYFLRRFLMLRESKYYCPECDDGRDHDYVPSRRQFLRAMGGAAALATVGSGLARGDEVKSTPKPAEGLIKELYATLNDEQKKTLVLPYDDKGENGML